MSDSKNRGITLPAKLDEWARAYINRQRAFEVLTFSGLVVRALNAFLKTQAPDLQPTATKSVSRLPAKGKGIIENVRT